MQVSRYNEIAPPSYFAETESGLTCGPLHFSYIFQLTTTCLWVLWLCYVNVLNFYLVYRKAFSTLLAQQRRGKMHYHRYSISQFSAAIIAWLKNPQLFWRKTETKFSIIVFFCYATVKVEFFVCIKAYIRCNKSRVVSFHLILVFCSGENVWCLRRKPHGLPGPRGG